MRLRYQFFDLDPSLCTPLRASEGAEMPAMRELPIGPSQRQPGGETGRRLHSVPAYGYILESERAISDEAGAEKVVRAGEGFVEAPRAWHNRRAVRDDALSSVCTAIKTFRMPLN